MGDNSDDVPPQGGGEYTGTCVKWLDRGFGFISPDDGGDDIFCHSSGLMSKDERDYLNSGEKVTYDLVSDERSNRMRAVNVVGDGSGTPPEPRDNGYRGDRDNSNSGYRRRDDDRDGGYRRRDDDDDRGSGRRRGGYRGAGGRGGGVCFNFRDNGECRFGEDCRFSHDMNG